MNATLEKVLGISGTGRDKKIYVSHLTVRQSISILILRLILIDIITAAIFLISHSVLFNTNISNALKISSTFYYTIIFLILILGKIVLTMYLVFEWLNEYYEIRADAITHHRGIIFRKIKRHDLALIRSAKVEYGFMAKILNYGTIKLYDIRLKRDISLYLIHNPLKYLHILEDIIPDLEEEKRYFRGKDMEDVEED